MQNENQVEILNDLVKINNDRIEGYRKATENLQENNPQLVNLFNQLQQQSQQYNQELSSQIHALGGTPASDSTTTSGKLYRAWMDVKATFGGDDAVGILNSCVGGEDAASKAYQNALASNELGVECNSLIARQHEQQMKAHNEIVQLRDQFNNQQ